MCYFQTFVIITDTSGNFELLYTLLKHLPSPPPFITGCIMTASLFVPLPSSLKPLHVLSALFLALPTAPATPPPQLYSSPHMGSSAQDLAERCHMMPTCVWCFAGTPSAQEMLSAFFPPSCSAAQSRALQLNPVTIPKHSSLIPTTARL